MKYYTSTQIGLDIKDFDMRHTIESAQPLTFFADYDFGNGILLYPEGDRMVKATFLGDNRNVRVRLDSSDKKDVKADFAKRFRLDDDMQKIYRDISTDAFVTSSIDRYYGMRLTLNDPWEATLCFIMSQYNNVKRIRKIIRCFVSEFGGEITDVNGNVVGKSFPNSDGLAKLKEEDFRRCGAGFRAKYIARAADYCTNNLDLYKLQGKGYEKIREELKGIYGVGDKVADCIALMGYGKLDAFPIDVWVKRTLEGYYFKGKKKRISELQEFADERWSGNRGYAQQYIFHHGRNIG